MDALNNDLLKLLTCPSCSKYMKEGAIYVCVSGKAKTVPNFCKTLISGHSICDLCWNIESCPVCKLAMSDIRNFSLEAISSLLYYPCTNENQGCPHAMKREELVEHQALCDYRSYKCMLNKYCCWQGTRDKLKKHYLDKHDGNVLIGEGNVCLWKNDKPDYTVYVSYLYFNPKKYTLFFIFS